MHIHFNLKVTNHFQKGSAGSLHRVAGGDGDGGASGDGSVPTEAPALRRAKEALERGEEVRAETQK